jgi:hypothetical protein
VGRRKHDPWEAVCDKMLFDIEIARNRTARLTQSVE